MTGNYVQHHDWYRQDLKHNLIDMSKSNTQLPTNDPLCSLTHTLFRYSHVLHHKFFSIPLH